MKDIPDALDFGGQAQEAEPIDPLEKERQDRRRAENLRRMTPAQRAKAKRDYARTTATFDMPNPLLDELKRISKEESVPQYNIVALALIDWIARYRAGEIDLSRVREMHGQSLKYSWKVPIEIPDAWIDQA